MELYIQQYLLAAYNCPLPGLGTLTLEKKSAEFSISDHTFSPPKWHLKWSNEVYDKSGFVHYLATALQTDVHEASSRLDEWVRQVTNHNSDFSLTVPGIGKWKKETGADIVFTAEKITDSFYQIKAKKIIRSGSTHQVRVGDAEHSSAHMTELLQQQKKSTRLAPALWIVLIITAIVVSVITYYGFNEYASAGFFGNTQKIETGNAPDTYQLIP